jgi:hypothetical protein
LQLLVLCVWASNGIVAFGKVGSFPCEIGLIFKAQMLQIGGIVKAILLPNDF